MEKQPVVLSFPPVVLHLVFLKGFETGLNLVDFAVKPIRSVISTIQPFDFRKSLTEFVKSVKTVLIDFKLIWLLL